MSLKGAHSNVPLALITVPCIDCIIAENTYFDLNLSPLKYDSNLGLLPFALGKIDFKTTAMYI